MASRIRRMVFGRCCMKARTPEVRGLFDDSAGHGKAPAPLQPGNRVPWARGRLERLEIGPVANAGCPETPAA